MKHYTIPFFIPHRGCPFTCVFCSQKKISGSLDSIKPSDIPDRIRRYLKAIPKSDRVVDAAFFGGSFTGLPPAEQISFLKAVQPFIKKKLIHSIRISTRPDYIDQKALDLVKAYNVSAIELGVQSISDDVLEASKRGHTASDVKKASKLILKNGIVLGHQMMVGLPKSTLAKEIATAKASIKMKASEVRIYPLLVIKGTKLEDIYRSGRYCPMSETEAISRCAGIVELFKENGIKILRLGLHPSEGLLTGKDIVAGPFHTAFGQKVESFIFGKRLKSILKMGKSAFSIKRILVNPKDEASAVGYERCNADAVEAKLGKGKIFGVSADIPKGAIRILYDDGSVKEDLPCRRKR